MTDTARPEVKDALPNLNGVQGQGQPTHVAIPIEVWKVALDTLGTLPYAQVEQLIPAIRGGAPMTLTGE